MTDILLLDAFSLVYRAFFALPAMSTTRGEPTGALYGFSTLLLKLLRESKAEGVAIALDTPEATFRHTAFPAYKGSRPAAPTPLGRQLRRLPEVLKPSAFRPSRRPVSKRMTCSRRWPGSCARRAARLWS
jgi:DNA polymerase I